MRCAPKILDMYGLEKVPEEIEDYISAASAEPAMEESAIFDAVVDILSEGDYDYYIYDLVPLGHALYYLSMAKIYDEWIGKITHLREEMREYEEVAARMRRQKEVAEDEILAELQYIRQRINAASRILTDRDRTAFFFVVVPEQMILIDTRKAAEMFAKLRCAGRRLHRQSRPARVTRQRGGAGLPAQPDEDATRPVGRDRARAGARRARSRPRAGARRHRAGDDRARRHADVRRGATMSVATDPTRLVSTSMADFMTAHPGLRYVFFGGKGGVGKTAMAGMTAVELARQGQARAAGLHQSSPLALRPAGSGRLRQADPGERRREPLGAGDRHQRGDRTLQAGNPREDCQWFLKFAEIKTKADEFVEAATTNPAFEESAMFENMVDLMFRGEYDVYVFDTAPTANARRLLGM